MKKIILALVVLVVLGLIFTYVGQDNTTGADGIEGRVTSVDTTGAAADDPVIIEISGEEGNTTIAVPSFGLPICAAYKDIADPFAITVGDIVKVKGDLDPEDRLLPCEEGSYLEVISTERDTSLGYEFNYHKGPDGYTVVLHNLEDNLGGIILYNTKAYDELRASTEPREAPVGIYLDIYNNTQKLSPSVWVDRNPRLSNIELALGEMEEAVVGGAGAVRYTVDGLYTTTTYVVAHDSKIYVLRGDSMKGYTDTIEDEFRFVVDSFSFIPTN